MKIGMCQRCEQLRWCWSRVQEAGSLGALMAACMETGMVTVLPVREDSKATNEVFKRLLISFWNVDSLKTGLWLS